MATDLERWRAGIQTQLVDRQTVEVARALSAGGVDSLLLKGPCLARLLYEEGELRTYDDTDLLVPLQMLTRAAEILRELGFARADNDPIGVVHATTWFRDRPQAGMVDLHRTLPGVRTPPAGLWRVLWSSRRTFALEGADVNALGLPATALLLATHRQHHGGSGRPRNELVLGATRIGLHHWREADVLAVELGVSDVLGAALRVDVPALADRLGLPADPVDPAAGRGPVGGLALVRAAGGRLDVLTALARRLLPPPGYMRSVERAGPRRLDLGISHLRRWRALARRRSAEVAARRAVGRRSSGD